MTDTQNDWYKPRTYLHFDPPISLDNATKLVTSPKRVTTHSFFPLIRFTLKSQKVRFNKETKTLEKKPIKERYISYASHLDSHIYSYYCQKISHTYEEILQSSTYDLDEVVLAFRAKGLSNIDFAKYAFEQISQRGNCCAIGLDIKGFFDNLDHKILRGCWSKTIGQEFLPPDHYAVYKSLTNFSFVEKDEVYDKLSIPKTNPRKGRTRICSPEDFRNIIRKNGLVTSNKGKNKGIPQGTSISALLSNIYMLNFDKEVSARLKAIDGKYIRYCDDMLLILPTDSKEEVLSFVYEEIEKLELEIQKEKNEIRTFKLNNGKQSCDKPLQYLGFTFDGQSIRIRSSSLARYYENVNKGIRLAELTMNKYNKLRIEHGNLPKPLHLKKLYKKYSYIGRRNFITYGHRAAEAMESKAIRKQLRPHWKRLRQKISDISGPSTS